MGRVRKGLILLLVSGGMALFFSVAHAGRALHVVVSIAPIHGLVSALLAPEQAPPHLLVRGGGSPHNYALRPSDALALQEADLIFWLGEGMETFLVKMLRDPRYQQRVVTLHQVPGMHLLPHRVEEAWWQGIESGALSDGQAGQAGQDGHGLGGDGPGHGHHGLGGEDMHVWLSPLNAQAMVRAIAQALMRVDPDNRKGYQARESALLTRLTQLDQEIAQRLESVQSIPFVMFHDGLHYFEKRYQLHAVTAVTPSPEHQPGVRRMREVRRLIQQRGVVCLFHDFSLSDRTLRTIVSDNPTRIGTIDILGSTIPLGPDHYFATMRALTDQVLRCLSPGSPEGNSPPIPFS